MKNEEQTNIYDLIPDQWYAIYLSSELKKDPVSLKRLGQNLVLWRDDRGEAVCADSACPHRGADLGLGRIVDGRLECRYHGFCFSSGGSCTRMPCEGENAAIPPSLNLNVHTIREQYGFVWLWYGTGEASQSVPWIPGTATDMSEAGSAQFDWSVRFSRVMEGMMDIHHIPFAHRPWMPGNLSRLDPYHVTVEDGIVYTAGTLRDESKPGSKGVSVSLNLAFPGIMQLTMGKPLTSVIKSLLGASEASKEERHGYEVYVACTPIDEENTWVAAQYFQSYISLPFVAQLFNWLAFQYDLKLIQPDDFRLLNSSLPRTSTTGTNHLVGADRGIAEWHRLQQKAVLAYGQSSEMRVPEVKSA